ncbi:MAG TPA: alpha/beta fold hydrolase [Thermomicrobiaceae bacterium]|nr:alpha/beta fold hydrolase [Thermomicrobiaceae bacterium]
MPSALINDTELFYREVGAGRPCLVMHGGLGGDHGCLYPWLDPLGDMLRLIYYDHRGNGRSGRPPLATLSYQQLAADADALRDFLGFDRVMVMGFSAGAAIALHYALTYPQRLSHLIIVGGHAAWDCGDEIMAACQRRGAAPEMLDAITRSPYDDADLARIVGKFMPLYLHRYDANLVERYVKNVRREAAANVRYGELLRDYNLVSRLGEIHVPTLIIIGRDDVVTPPTQAERLDRGIPHSELVIVDHSGHMPYLEEPERFCQVVLDWLARTL